MTTPLDDPRAAELLAAQPDDVSAMAANFAAAADEARSTAAGLSAAREDGTWTGKAATAFRDAIGRLPQQLQHVHQGYADVARALGTYEPELSRIQARFVAVIDRLSTVRSHLGPATTAAQTAHGSLSSTARATHVKRSVLIAAELAVAQADGAVNAYHREIAGLNSQAFALLDEFAAARSTCRDAVATAQRTAPVRPPRHSGSGVIGTVAGATVLGIASQSPVTVVGASAGQQQQLPAQARRRVQAMIDRADSLLGTPYAYGGGHSGWDPTTGLDCSGFVSAVLRCGGYLQSPQTTEGLSSQPELAGGRGRFVTIYDRTGCGANEHVIIDLNGHFYESGGGGASGGAPDVHRFDPSPAYLSTFNTVLHPVGL